MLRRIVGTLAIASLTVLTPSLAQATTGGAEEAVSSGSMSAPRVSLEFVGVPGDYIYDPSRGALHDYCTKSPDSWMGADFRGPCARHDICMERKPNGPWQDCHNGLLRDMKENCEAKFGAINPLRYQCIEIAAGYWAVVTGKN